MPHVDIWSAKKLEYGIKPSLEFVLLPFSGGHLFARTSKRANLIQKKQMEHFSVALCSSQSVSSLLWSRTYRKSVKGLNKRYQQGGDGNMK